jgi:hypothetical protein
MRNLIHRTEGDGCHIGSGQTSGRWIADWQRQLPVPIGAFAT